MGNCTKATTTDRLHDPEQGYFDSQAQDALDQATADLNDKIDEIRGELSSLTPHVSSSSGSLPNLYFGDLLGVDFRFNLAQYADQMDWITQAIMFLAFLIAFAIIMDKR
ncbi:hypothetical protein CCP3SC15_1410001 [Gammaproteobacteria bacterium]